MSRPRTNVHLAPKTPHPQTKRQIVHRHHEAVQVVPALDQIAKHQLRAHLVQPVTQQALKKISENRRYHVRYERQLPARR